MSEQAIRVVYVEDDEAVRAAGRQTFALADMDVIDFPRAEAALAELGTERAVVLVTDVRLPGMDGMSLLRRASEIDPDLPVILVTGHGDVGMAVEAMRTGAYDFIEKPFAPEHLVEVVGRAMEKRRLVLENRALKARLAQADGVGGLIGDSGGMRNVRRLVIELGDTDVDVLIEGETGTGKERVARGLHEAGRRRSGNFVAINCAALPESVFESEMFGVEPGAYTGATRSRAGKIEHASGGTLFLDEIEGMALPLQAKLLRVLQERVVERLGANRLVPVDCRVVAATKLDLKAEVAAGRFRADLYYRLNVVTIGLPPLRARREDIPQLFSAFCLEAAERYHRPPPALSPAVFDWLMGQDWPGNVRELQHVADRLVLGVWRPGAELAAVEGAGLAQRLAAFEHLLIDNALRQCNGDVAAAAEALAVPRKTLYDKIGRFGIDMSAYRGGEARA
ncbi:MAG: sigma-54-dependent Fis family transcriptional regulator [Thauera phenolivorans]|uniref:Sigma-54-dependent Fis family transcriptional regulator n=1 Tax=Thauera phenolivorans TaxID=1792543 RepID=A0A7X7R6W9_9RHOO|nr:sigma-54 dependent transcriptional regulator [Thauera phenolivorans]NLF53142.1 sigma-54-dependent Fis family transcriptional regulator [Thauera phenolivorans]